jgi:predicted membrane-bound spermidine synthase
MKNNENIYNEIELLNNKYKGKAFTNKADDKIEIVRFYIDGNEIYCSYKNYRYSDTQPYGGIWKYFKNNLIELN